MRMLHIHCKTTYISNNEYLNKIISKRTLVVPTCGRTSFPRPPDRQTDRHSFSPLICFGDMRNKKSYLTWILHNSIILSVAQICVSYTKYHTQTSVRCLYEETTRRLRDQTTWRPTVNIVCLQCDSLAKTKHHIYSSIIQLWSHEWMKINKPPSLDHNIYADHSLFGVFMCLTSVGGRCGFKLTQLTEVLKLTKIEIHKII